jgi:hypothetical protein
MKSERRTRGFNVARGRRRSDSRFRGRAYLPRVVERGRYQHNPNGITAALFLSVVVLYLALLALSLTDFGLNSTLGEIFLLSGPIVLCLFFVGTIVFGSRSPRLAPRRAKGDRSSSRSLDRLIAATVIALGLLGGLALARGEAGIFTSILVAGLLGIAIMVARSRNS